MLETIDLASALDPQEYKRALVKYQVGLNALATRSTCSSAR